MRDVDIKVLQKKQHTLLIIKIYCLLCWVMMMKVYAVWLSLKYFCVKEINRSTGMYSISSEEFDDKILAPMKTSHLQVAVALLKNLSC